MSIALLISEFSTDNSQLSCSLSKNEYLLSGVNVAIGIIFLIFLMHSPVIGSFSIHIYSGGLLKS